MVGYASPEWARDWSRRLPSRVAVQLRVEERLNRIEDLLGPDGLEVAEGIRHLVIEGSLPRSRRQLVPAGSWFDEWCELAELAEQAVPDHAHDELRGHLAALVSAYRLFQRGLV